MACMLEEILQVLLQSSIALPNGTLQRALYVLGSLSWCTCGNSDDTGRCVSNRTSQGFAHDACKEVCPLDVRCANSIKQELDL